MGASVLEVVDAACAAAPTRLADTVAIEDVAVVAGAHLVAEGGEVRAADAVAPKRSITAVAAGVAALADSSVVHVLVSACADATVAGRQGGTVLALRAAGRSVRSAALAARMAGSAIVGGCQVELLDAGTGIRCGTGEDGIVEADCAFGTSRTGA